MDNPHRIRSLNASVYGHSDALARAHARPPGDGVWFDDLLSRLREMGRV